jgi:hypothetical protein
MRAAVLLAVACLALGASAYKTCRSEKSEFRIKTSSVSLAVCTPAHVPLSFTTPTFFLYTSQGPSAHHSSSIPLYFSLSPLSLYPAVFEDGEMIRTPLPHSYLNVEGENEKQACERRADCESDNCF